MTLPQLVNLLTVVGLIAIMLSMGFKVTIPELAASIQKPRQIVAGLVVNFVLMPATTIGLLFLFAPDPLVSTGFVILAVCAGAPVGPPFAAVAKGDVPYATGLMALLAGFSAVLSPILLGVLLPRLISGDGELRIDYFAIVRTLLLSQMLPLAVGLGLHCWSPKLISRIAKPTGQAANVLLLVVVAIILVQQYESLALIRLRGWFGMLLLLALSLAMGWICGGPGLDTRKSLAVTTSTRNAAVALVIVSANFADTPAVTAVVAYALFSTFATLAFAFLFASASGNIPRSEASGS